MAKIIVDEKVCKGCGMQKVCPAARGEYDSL